MTEYRKKNFNVTVEKSRDELSISNSLLCVDVYDGKYRVIQSKDGRVRALRYGEEWRDCTGDGLLLALAYEVEELRNKNT